MNIFSAISNVCEGMLRQFYLLKENLVHTNEEQLHKLLVDPKDSHEFQKAIAFVTENPGQVKAIKLAGKDVTVSI